MVTELSGIARGEALAVDLHESIVIQLSIWTVSHEAPVPLMDSGLIILGVHHQEVHVCLGQLVLAALCPHDVGYGDNDHVTAVLTRIMFLAGHLSVFRLYSDHDQLSRHILTCSFSPTLGGFYILLLFLKVTFSLSLEYVHLYCHTVYFLL